MAHSMTCSEATDVPCRCDPPVFGVRSLVFQVSDRVLVTVLQAGVVYMLSVYYNWGFLLLHDLTLVPHRVALLMDFDHVSRV